MMAHKYISTQTFDHVITITDGKLTIAGEQKILTPEETLLLLEVLLIWQYGLEAVMPDDQDDSLYAEAD